MYGLSSFDCYVLPRSKLFGSSLLSMTVEVESR